MADEIERGFPVADDEHAMLDGFLRYCQQTLLVKIADVGDDDLRRPLVPSGTSLLGLIKHVAYVHRWWFRVVFAGEQVPLPWTDDDPDADWRIEPHETTEQVLAFYQAELGYCRALVAAVPLDTPFQAREQRYTLRWLLIYMTVELARHAGHADILRELADGRTGR